MYNPVQWKKQEKTYETLQYRNEEVSKPKDKMVIDGETWYHYKTFDNADACIANVNKIQEEHFREWEGGSMCWSEDLYYSLGK